MNKSQPSLEDLGLDAPVDKGPFGKAFDNYDSSKDEQPKTWVDSVKSDPTMLGPSDLLASILAALLGPVGFWYKGCWAAGFGWLLWIGLGILGGLLFPLLPLIVWVLMIIHAFIIKPGKTY